MNRTSLLYPFSPINSVQALSRTLAIDVASLVDAAQRANNLYSAPFPAKKKKKDGSVRMVQKALEPLAAIQDRIKTNLLDKVDVPNYLMGGLRSTHDCKRGTKSNAEFHADSSILISEDVSSFFPSISAQLIYEMWRRLFGFNDEVSSLLTRLTSKESVLPQGASTSSAIANFILFDVEPGLKDRLAAKGLRYSRLIDDISISSVKRASSESISFAISQTVGMLSAKGLKIKRAKHSIDSKSSRQIVNGICINNGTSASSADLKRIRAAIHQLASADGLIDPKGLEKVIGRIRFIQTIDSKNGNKLLSQLHALIPASSIKKALSHLGRKRALSSQGLKIGPNKK